MRAKPIVQPNVRAEWPVVNLVDFELHKLAAMGMGVITSNARFRQNWMKINRKLWDSCMQLRGCLFFRVFLRMRIPCYRWYPAATVSAIHRLVMHVQSQVLKYIKTVFGAWTIYSYSSVIVLLNGRVTIPCPVWPRTRVWFSNMRQSLLAAKRGAKQ